jgi:putative chitinase
VSPDLQLVTPAQLHQVMPLLDPLLCGQYAAPLSAAFREFGIANAARIAAAVAQLAHESNQLTEWEEDLNHGAKAILALWPRHFSPAEAELYKHRPEATANRAYADRMGNGPEESEDGWRFHGRGPIQITGRTNYTKAALALGVDLVRSPMLASSPAVGFRIAGWFWESNGLNPVADQGDFLTITKRINGGLNGYEQRLHFWAVAKQVFHVEAS